MRRSACAKRQLGGGPPPHLAQLPAQFDAAAKTASSIIRGRAGICPAKNGTSRTRDRLDGLAPTPPAKRGETRCRLGHLPGRRSTWRACRRTGILRAAASLCSEVPKSTKRPGTVRSAIPARRSWRAWAYGSARCRAHSWPAHGNVAACGSSVQIPCRHHCNRLTCAALRSRRTGLLNVETLPSCADEFRNLSQ